MEGKSVSKDLKIAAGQFVKEKEYWIKKLSGEIDKCYFPYDNYKESTAGEYRKNPVIFNISGEPYARLIKITGDSYPKIHMVLTTAVVTLAAQYTGSDDMIVGTSIEKQDTEESFINTILPLRISLPLNMTFKELILEMRKTINEAIENQNYPIETLTHGQERLFDAAVLLENIQEKKYIQHLQTGITFSFRAAANQIEGELEYDTDKYEKESINRIIDHFMRLLRIALLDVNVKINDIQLLSPKDREELSRFNCTRAGYPHQKTIHELFQEQAGKTPDNIALVKGNHKSPQQISYRGLNEKSNRLAQWLKQENVEPGDIVAIMIAPSIEMITGIMGILKAGGAYLPIDPDYPRERIDYILKDSGAKILLTAPDLESVFESSPTTLTSTCQTSPTNLAYIIYTSGSTGKPKGVAVEHRALVNYVWWAAKTYVKNEKVNFPLYTSISFDLTITSLFTPLITGNTVYIYRGEHKEFLLDKLFDENKVEAVKLTPVHLMVTGDNIQEKNLSKIKRFIVGGEKLETQWARKIHENFGGNIEIYNEYGPTEAAVGCMIYKYNPRKDKGASVPIGIPADNVRIYLLDKNMKDAPVGGIGQLYIAGDGLARGYLNKPGLTAEKFRKAVISRSSLVIGSSPKTNNRSSKFSTKNQYPIANDRLYQTGDMARRLPDGNLEFLGRQDQQVKVRGYRIETGEIENCLCRHEHIGQAVVAAKDDENGYKYLAAYIVLDGKEEKKDIDTGELREYLLKYLPEFMIPSYFIEMEKIPVTANGKIDKKSLPDPDKNTLETGTEYLPPTTELEKIMVEIWQDVMGVEKVGINDSYFSLGGDSIKAIQISARLHNVNWKLELKDLFQYTTIKELVNHIKPVKEISYQGMIEGDVKLTPIQEWFFEKKFTHEHHFNQAVILHRPERFDEEITEKVFDKLLKHHDALRIVFKREDGKIKQINRKFLPGMMEIEVFDLTGETNYRDIIGKESSRIQASIDLSVGPLVKLGLFKSMDGDYLLIVIHHLVMDTVSWRILSEDFTSLYQQIKNKVQKENLEIPLKSTSYQKWAEKLYEYANSKKILKELEYWKKREDITPIAFFKNKAKIKENNKDNRQMAFELPEDYTGKLLKQVNSAYNTEINDILLAALGIAVNQWTGASEISLIMEGHGREEIIPDIDITRTVGWFTSVYPLVIKIKNRDDVAAVIKNTKEMLRNIPDKGIGYGILRYLASRQNKQDIQLSLNPEISFNYLGQFDEDIKSESFRAAEISSGNSVSLNNERIYPLYILGGVFNKRLRISIGYGEGGFKENEIRSFIDGFERSLRQIIDHCTAKKDTEFTLSDYTVPIPRQEAELVFGILGKSNINDMYFLSPMQEGMLFHYLMDKNSPAYFEQTSYRIQGQLDYRLFEQSFNRLIERYDVLRTIFVHEKMQRPLQVVLRRKKASVYYEDISHLDETQREQWVKEFKIKDKTRGFELEKDILIRLSIVKLAEEVYEIIWSFHHIIMDGWCVAILIKDTLSTYYSLKQGKTITLPPAPPYKNYIKWLEKQNKETGIKYWKRYLDNYENRVVIPRGTEEKTKKYELKGHRFRINQALIKKFITISNEHNVTMSTIIQTLWGILLQKYNNTDDVVFGAIVSGRPANLENVETMVGLFINAIPIRIKAEPGENFLQLVKKVQSQMIQSRQYEFVPLVEIQSHSLLKRELINHLFIFENYPVDKQIEHSVVENTPLFSVESVELFEQTTYDLNVMGAFAKELELHITYNASVYDDQVIKRVEVHLEQVSKQVTGGEIPLEEIEVISRPEKEQILFGFNNNKAPYPEAKAYELFENHEAIAPGRTAVIHEDRLLSYGQLNRDVNRAARLFRHYGIGAEHIVAILLERSHRLFEIIMALWKVGAAYIPMETDYPPQRVKEILENSETPFLVTRAEHVHPEIEKSFQGRIIKWDKEKKTIAQQPGSNPELKTDINGLAYILYTSGSTGKPKGAMVEHIGSMNHMQGKIRDTEMDAHSIMVQNGPQTFDISIWQFFAPLTLGSRTVIYTHSLLLEPDRFITRLIRDQVTILEVVPSYLTILLDFLERRALEPLQLKYLLPTGEELKPLLVKKWFKLFPHIKMINTYGPTEASDDVAHYIMEKPPETESIPLGKPLPNLNMYIVDKNMKLCPVGVKGEICVSGIGVGRGYLKDETRTKLVFMEDPFQEEKGIRLYKMGDLGAWLPDGNLLFFGRKDYQVKIRGHLIECGEIENRLLEIHPIKEAVVIDREDKKGNKYLTAYLVSDAKLDITDIKTQLSAHLPAYMIPAYFMEIDGIPLTANGKIHRKALPLPQLSIGGASEHHPPRDEVEKILAEIWKELLAVPEPGINDNFFDSGGHSLNGMTLISSIHKRLNVEIPIVELFNRPTIKEISGYIKNTRKTAYTSIQSVEKRDYYILSSAQNRLVVLDNIAKKSTAYNLYAVLEFAGSLDTQRLEKAFKDLIKRHESLRTAFPIINGNPVQVIHEHVDFQIQYYNENKIVEGEKNIRSIIHDSFIRPFDLSQAPLIRAGLIKTGEMKYLAMLDIHHIVCDGVAFDTIVKDISRLYAGESLPGLRIQYKDYALRQLEMMKTEESRNKEKYWLEKLSGEIPVLNMFTDYPRPPVQSFAGSNFTFKIEKELTEKIKTLSAEKGATLYMTLLAAYYTLLSIYTGQDDIIVGTPTAGRQHADLKDILGMFVNMLTMRNYPTGKKPFNQFLREVKENALNAYQNQDYQFEELVANLDLNRDLSRNPLFDTLFAVQNMEIREIRMEDLQVSKYNLGEQTAKFDITLYAYEIVDEILLEFIYCTKLFKSQTIERLCRHFIKVVEEVVRFPQLKLHEIQVLSKSEEKQLLYEFNNTENAYPQDKTIPGLFQRQVEKIPDHIAVTGSPQMPGEHRQNALNSAPNIHVIQVTYKELNEKSNRLARWIREKGIKPDSIAGIMVNRSLEMITGIMGIIKAGGAYLPIDPDFPKRRIYYMLDDSSAKLLLTADEIRAKSNPNSNSNSNLTSTSTSTGHPSPSNLAYVIYTSGTTGNPKGTVIQHRSLVNRLNWMQKKYPVNTNDTILQKTTFTFDVSVWEILWWAIAGAKVCLLDPGGEKNPGTITQTIERNNVTTMHFVPSMLSVFLDYLKASGEVKKLSTLKQVIASGEALLPRHVELFNQLLNKENSTKLANLYGPTEATIDVSYFDCPEGENRQIIPIGKPIDNICLYILDKHLRIKPVGVSGELCIAGIGLTRGYLNQPELTEEKFKGNLSKIRLNKSYISREVQNIPGKNVMQSGSHAAMNPAPQSSTIHHSPLHRSPLYRTGDLTRWLPDGNIEFLGRIDQQVKVRGFRIELDEIKNRLLKHEHITGAVVTAKEGKDNNKVIAAYIVSEPEPPVPQLKEFLSGELPDYMIPSYFVQIPRIPLTPNGKIDKSKLPEPDVTLGEEYAPPADKIEEALLETWKEVLELEKIGVNDIFFNIGGDSIRAIRLISMINIQFGANLGLVDIFKNRTIKELAGILKKVKTAVRKDDDLEEVFLEIDEFQERVMRGSGSQITKIGEVEAIYPMSEIEKGMVFYYLKNTPNALYHDQAVYQQTFNDFDIRRMKKAISLMTGKHPILRTAFVIESFAHVIYKNNTSFEEIVGYEDISGMEKKDRKAAIKKHLENSRGRPFNLMQPPLWRLTFFKTSEKIIAVAWEYHHSIIDGWSNASFLTELNNIYHQLKVEPDFKPAKLKGSYREYITGLISGKKNIESRQYWKEQLSDYKRLNFPKRPGEKSDKRYLRMGLGIELRDQLTTAAEKYKTDLKHLCLAAYIYMLAMLSRENDITTGLLTHNRPVCQDGDKILGCFLNTVPFRVQIPGNIKWSDYIRLIDKEAIKLKKYERLPLSDILKIIGEESGNRNPVFDSLFNYIDFHVFHQMEHREEQLKIEDFLELEGYENTNFLYTISINVFKDAFFYTCQYSPSILSEEESGRLYEYFVNVLNMFIHYPGKIIDKNDIIPFAERKRLLEEFNLTGSQFPDDKTVHGLVEKQVESTPDRTASATRRQGTGDREQGAENKHQEIAQITYRELNEKSNQLARVLIKKDIKPGNIVGIMVERSIEMIVGLLAILKAGGAYLPIDPGYPGNRIDYMLKDSNAKILVTTPKLQVKVKAEAIENAGLPPGLLLQFINTEGDFDSSFKPSSSTLTSASTCQVSPANLAYLIYTSGTTGRPKGVMIKHRSLVNYLWWAAQTYVKKENSNFPLYTSIAFDLTATSVFTPLITGNTVIVYASEAEDKNFLIRDVVKDKSVGIVKLTPSHLKLIRDENVFTANLHCLIVGGEELDSQLARDIRENFKGSIEIYNEYGPTEASVGCMTYKFNPLENRGKSVPIGIPVHNAKVYILDRRQSILPIGAAGELHISGEGLAAGYLNSPELTAEKFIKTVISHSSLAVSSSKKPTKDTNDQCLMTNDRLYRTGDLARRYRDGNIEFIGRIDRQVKIRGSRIEPEEIETHLVNHPGIKEAVVNAKTDENGDNYLAAYIVSQHEQSVSELREYLLTHFPANMIPSYFYQIEQIPLTANGKIDINALKSVGTAMKPDAAYAAPGNYLEKKIVDICKKILRRDKIGIHDNFFEMGADSLGLLKIAAAIKREFNLEIPVSQLLWNPTIKKTTLYIWRQQHTITIDAVVEEKFVLLNTRGETYMNLFLFPPIIGVGTAYMSLSLRLSDYNLYSFNFIEDDRRIQQYADTIMEIQEKGPYRLFGYSSGGNLAFEVARELEQRGEQVSDIIIVDSWYREVKLIFSTENPEQEEVLMGEFLETNMKQIGLEDYKGQVMEKWKHYSQYYDNSLDRGKVNARIHLITSNDRQESKSRLIALQAGKATRHLNLDWEGAAASCTVYEGSGNHEEMFFADYVDKNVAIIRKILEESRSGF